MNKMKWWEWLGNQLGFYQWCSKCWDMKWFHKSGHCK